MKYGPRANYLEVGVSKGFTLQEVRAHHRVGVEPAPQFNTRLIPPRLSIYEQTSDSYFANAPRGFFDVVFIDGLHEAKQAYRDVCGAMRALKIGGAIVIDDVLPKNFESSIPDKQASLEERASKGMTDRAWYGDTYKVIALIDRFHQEIRIQFLGNSAHEHCQAILDFPEANRKLSFTPYPFAGDLLDAITYGEVFGDSPAPQWQLAGKSLACSSSQSIAWVQSLFLGFFIRFALEGT